MITYNEIVSKLSNVIVEAPDYNDLGEVVFKQSILLEEGLTVTIDNFLIIFADAESLTSSELLRIDDGKKGYEFYVLEWKSKGYIE